MTYKIFILIIIASLFAAILPIPTSAQTNEIWSESENISRSGSSTSPSFTISSQGLIHVFWLDEFDDVMYAQSNGNNWSTPQRVSVPSDRYVPQIFAGPNNQIHAFWIDEEGILSYMRATSDNLGNSNTWSGFSILGENVAFFDVAISPDGVVNLAYVQTADVNNRPAGLYYRKTNANATTWQQPVQIYASRYFRSLTRDSANVQIAIREGENGNQIFLAWDNRPIKSLFFARSLSGGDTWESPLEIVSPQMRASSTTPYNVQIATLLNQIVLVYQDGQPGFSCSQSFQYSEDQGASWTEPTRMMENIPGCAISSQLLNFGNNYLILLTINRDQVLLTAWNTKRWSDSKQQSEMIQVIDPVTRSNLTLANQQVLIDNSSRLHLIASDLEQKDIWWKQRDLSDVDFWFQSNASWLRFETITVSEKGFSSIAATSDSQGQFHTFWSSGDFENFNAPNTIYYSRWEDRNRWIRTITIHQSSNEYIDQIVANFDPTRNNLLLIWRDGLKGSINFSSAPSNQAFVASSWSVPVLISSPTQTADSPTIAIDSSGRIVIVYSIPINEGRGIYTTTSNDGGLTWSPPNQVINAQTLGLEAINNPQLAMVDERNYHLIWMDYQFVENRFIPNGLYYSRSLDGGQTWTEPVKVNQSQVLWAQLLVSPTGVVHRIWQERSEQDNFLHEYSANNGENWQKAVPYSSFGEKIGQPAVGIDPSGRLHSIQIIRPSENNFSLEPLRWENYWYPDQAIDILENSISNISTPVVIISPEGFLGVIISVDVVNSNDNLTEHRLIFTGQQLENIPVLDIRTPTITEDGNNPQEPTIVKQPEAPTLSQAEPTRVINTTPASIINPTIGILIGVIFSFLVIAAIIIYHIWQKTSG